MTETWRPIPGWEGFYEASDQGEVRSLPRWVAFGNQKRLAPSCVVAPWKHPAGYRVAGLSRPGTRTFREYVHRLVASAFHGPGEGLEVNHRNGVKTDNRAENLEWVSRAENLKHARRTGLMSGHRGGYSHTTQLQRDNLVALKQMGMSMSDAARCLGMSVPTACRLGRQAAAEAA